MWNVYLSETLWFFMTDNCSLTHKQNQFARLNVEKHYHEFIVSYSFLLFQTQLLAKTKFEVFIVCINQLTGSPLINQERFAGGLLCHDVHIAVIVSPTLTFPPSLTPVIVGVPSGRSARRY